MFADREDAGRRLARAVGPRAAPDAAVLGLPRGGVVVAAEVASALSAPLDVILVRKLGVPSQPELAMGAIGEDGVRVLNEDVLRLARLPAAQVDAVEQRERAELERRAALYREGLPRLVLGRRMAIVVDDGIATGSTARAACLVARAHGAAEVLLAVPVAPPDWTVRLDDAADDFVCVETPVSFMGVGQFYADFRQTSDDEVVECLAAARRRVAAAEA